MKKILLGIALSLAVLQSCKKDHDEEEIVVIPIEDQNAYDDAAAIKFMDSNYFNDKGVITAFDDTVTTDDNYPKLSSYPHETLPSGVIYIIRTGAQPDPGTIVGEKDILTFFHSTYSYIATNTDGKINFGSSSPFVNSISSGNPSPDPAYYYVKQSVLDAYNKANNTTVGRDFYEIEGLREGLKYFKSFNQDNAVDYNMQGVIIVPSRAAYARDNTIYGTLYKDRSFVFNFQLYKTETRLPKDD
ncbi:hypothetical protein [Epilithonimonas zeae]|uniref:hypothetical protein n=1 Tax=Epilithonimonas zeae TaxID=1416779 RepID=UPI00200C2DB2|nr:hypothetical protein [Epilithonimonas zeae]UQB68590.1 hypothetical protein KI430_16470 [Epilithonimonas zeae]